VAIGPAARSPSRGSSYRAPHRARSPAAGRSGAAGAERPFHKGCFTVRARSREGALREDGSPTVRRKIRRSSSRAGDPLCISGGSRPAYRSATRSITDRVRHEEECAAEPEKVVSETRIMAALPLRWPRTAGQPSTGRARTPGWGEGVSRRHRHRSSLRRPDQGPGPGSRRSGGTARDYGTALRSITATTRLLRAHVENPVQNGDHVERDR
jgi:hypothetical protein